MEKIIGKFFQNWIPVKEKEIHPSLLYPKAPISNQDAILIEGLLGEGYRVFFGEGVHKRVKYENKKANATGDFSPIAGFWTGPIEIKTGTKTIEKYIRGCENIYELKTKIDDYLALVELTLTAVLETLEI